ncbi:uncharacterized protein LOC122429059 isoform X6 [Cervus canadensis]|uniref:uncharacterized protein LOC122429059 isoform X6 n=1 Tax=Cervus canadensis TaxID=1574408 RepID=UPI001CA380E0|nr:uncharacterized protein LOC122429059 isoform X6 [Cervus canadensis]
MSLLPGDHRSLDTQRGQWVKFQAIKKKYGCFSNVPTGAIPTSLERAVASECGCQEESRNAKEPKHVRPSCSHTHTPQTPRKRVRITGKETANQVIVGEVICSLQLRKTFLGMFAALSLLRRFTLVHLLMGIKPKQPC